MSNAADPHAQASHDDDSGRTDGRPSASAAPAARSLAYPGIDPGAIAARVRAARKTTRRGVAKPFREAVKLDRHLSRAAHHLARAAAKGLAAYREGQDESAAARRNGAIVEQPKNAAAGLAVAMVEASRVPVDLARALTTRGGRRLVRLTARLVLSPLER